MTNRQLFLSHQAQTTHFPLQIEVDYAEGIYMYSPDGKQYCDLISGIGVSNLGHRHPNVIQAAKNQLDRYLHVMVYGEMVQSPQTQLAEALHHTLPFEQTWTYFVNSGSEAVEGALKLAKRYTGKAEIMSCFDAYHGSSHGALSAGGNEIFKQAYRPLLPGFTHIRHGNIEDLKHITKKTAAIIIEVVQGEAGLRTADQAYFDALQERCNACGTLIICDEIQSGFGRTGTFWSFEHYGLKPDIVVSAKGMGGGMPIGAFMAPQDIMGVFRENPILGHITTFGGHPVSAAASLATLKTLKESGLIEQVPQKAALFIEHLQHPHIKEIRNKGLMMAAEMESFEVLKAVIDRAIELGVVTDWFLFCDNSMRIAPPLIITEEEIVQCCDLIKQAIDETLGK
ncbi:MAG: aspartate aminotransferase family protein [Cyclobacteriaceae bacterium]|nr:aspartate aminotransferase family protein [Cyclobacteriaceae bacterium]MCH8517336.1 aspartate aminotransferase family protein [Cyclobacteriaceae bacterium]